VERILRAVYVTPLALAPSIVLGAINIAGQILPVFNLRRRLDLPERPITPADYFLVARMTERRVVLVIDAPQGVIDQPAASMIDAASVIARLSHIRGLISLEDGLVLIHDLERFLTADEMVALDSSLSQDTARGD
jgi:purine-binding chemotaxis protein CheW